MKRSGGGGGGEEEAVGVGDKKREITVASLPPPGIKSGTVSAVYPSSLQEPRERCEGRMNGHAAAAAARRERGGEGGRGGRELELERERDVAADGGRWKLE